ncbi:hypothetical protein EDD29_1921 [Actinocorallia herbida]|uniref:Uncharacterized protein n=1 Tax=Actinocorallia herbida TaxID=58109 RepID=A0A3N1CUL8_9ACTN|nr:hypothetical protein [Actinocorallia herbida]ROO84398.1 hypothetical protein EDD29_1921 [Actinocorallia herbida]
MPQNRRTRWGARRRREPSARSQSDLRAGRCARPRVAALDAHLESGVRGERRDLEILFRTGGPLGGPEEYLVTAHRPKDLFLLPDGAALLPNE